MKCPTCGRNMPKPREAKVAKVDWVAISRQLGPYTPNPAYRLIGRKLVKPTRFDADGRAIGRAYVEKVYDRNWAEQRYGHSPFDTPKDKIGHLGTLESVQKKFAEGQKNS